MIDHPLHPAVVHFPIALLMTAVFFELAGLWGRRDLFRQFGFWLLALGLVAGVVSAGVGFWVHEAVEKSGVPEEAVDRHESLAVATLITFAVLMGYRRWARDRWTVRHQSLYSVLALAGAILLALTGYFGGDLVYQYGAGVQKTAPGSSVSPVAPPPVKD